VVSNILMILLMIGILASYGRESRMS